ncbi:hypothetical protein OIU79_021334 [Salix purpurea]|uniref:Uncharacterized protein n=1 Tax=Salix purpurea TaxID=77065 RepID=A0A9Q0WP41_SALPP|nr:hypothetical protein OIU79_021334 [Salix purpurea]
MSEYEINDGENNINGDNERIAVWEMGLSTPDELTPLSQPLIPPEYEINRCFGLQYHNIKHLNM